MDGAQDVVVVRGGVDQSAAGGEARVAQDGGALRDLGARRHDADPHLALRLVTQHGVGPDHGRQRGHVVHAVTRAPRC